MRMPVRLGDARVIEGYNFITLVRTCNLVYLACICGKIHARTYSSSESRIWIMSVSFPFPFPLPSPTCTSTAGSMEIACRRAPCARLDGGPSGNLFIVNLFIVRVRELDSVCVIDVATLAWERRLHGVAKRNLAFTKGLALFGVVGD